jgi:hypothetical protein
VKRRIAIGTTALALALAASASATAPAVTPTTIAGVRLGLTAASYEKLLGAHHVENAKGGDLSSPGFQQPDGWSRVVFPQRRMNVYFNGGKNAILITTWNKSYRTAAGVGPCSTVAQLKKAYGPRLKPSPNATQNGTVYVYTMGKLLFADEDQSTVTAVGLYDPRHKALGYASFVIQPPDQTSCS